jgi:AraC-like DNA-binding protein
MAIGLRPMDDTLGAATGGGLERSCGTRRGDWVRASDWTDGVQRFQAWFAGHGFDPHRHDTYAIGVTDAGVQAFDYRGATRISTPGRVVVLHPDEAHDGRAATEAGFGYRIVYVAPARIAEAVRAIRGRACALPFARDVVMTSRPLAEAVDAGFRDPLEPLAVDRLILRLAEGLLRADPSCGPRVPLRVDTDAVARARRFLDTETSRVVVSSELETIAGLTRFELARQFRAVVGTSPYRYSVMRRLEAARMALTGPCSLVEVALGRGFADQAHFSRMFKAAFGVTPARYRTLDGQERRASGQKRMPSRA